MEQKILRTGTWVVACAIVLRLLSAWVGTAPEILPAKLASFMIYMQTGRLVHIGSATQPASPTEPTAPTQPTSPTEPPDD